MLLFFGPFSSAVLLLSLTTTTQDADLAPHPVALSKQSVQGIGDALGPAFEVATVRPSSKEGHGTVHFIGTRLMPSGRLSVRSIPLSGLVSFAYIDGSGKGQVDGGPPWVKADQYDIEAKVNDSQMADWDKLSDADRRELVRAMMRTLLEERFHLKLHTETRVTPVYALVQAKSGSKLKPVPETKLEGDGDESQKVFQWMKDHPGSAAPGSIMCAGNGCTGHAVELKSGARQISASAGADRTVVDETGLTGRYDFSYSISHEEGDMSPMQQIEDQLGLRFEPRKIPIKTYVIDSAERPEVE